MYDKNRQCLLDMKEAGEKILSFTKSIHTLEAFHQNEIVFDAVMMNIIIIGEAVSRLSEDFTDENSHIDWRKIKGLRNIVAHDYFGIDAEEIWQIVQNVIPVFLNQINKLLERP